MNVYTETFPCGDRKYIDVYLERDGVLRVDKTDAGPVLESLYGDFDYERIIQIEEGAKLLPYLIRDGLAGKTLTFDRIGELAEEAGLSVSGWSG